MPETATNPPNSPAQPFHLRVPREQFDPAVLDATDRLFKSYPWRETPGGTPQMKYQKWADRVCTALGAPEVMVVIDPSIEAAQYTEDDRILINVSQTTGKPSVTSLFWLFYAHLRKHGVVAGEQVLEGAGFIEVAMAKQREWEAQTSWAYSLFYVVRPERFLDAVRNGRLFYENFQENPTTAQDVTAIDSDSDDAEDPEDPAN